jgi:hypothetical protein
MMRVGVAELPLHPGRCPPWLFEKMRHLGGAIAELIIEEHGRHEFLRRLGDPFFFQALGCTLGYDWHSSGLTTTVCAALKEGIEPQEIGVAVCGGKGKTSRQTQSEIEKLGEVFPVSSNKLESLKYASRMAAKVDNACVQDGYQLYHHCFILSEDGDWAVIQQGMQDRTARRYHWLSDRLGSFVEEPHSGIAADRVERAVLDMTAHESEETRRTSVDVARDNPNRLTGLIREAGQHSMDDYMPSRREPSTLTMPASHMIPGLSARTVEALRKAYELQPESYEELVAIRGIGPRAVRALALVSELVYGASPAWKDPAKYSFAHGGKDGIPFPVDVATYRKTIEMIENATRAARVGDREKADAIKRLHNRLTRYS